MGATDVVPFIPLEGTTMEDCIVLARTLGERVGRELRDSRFLYERAASTPSRENLADVRRGEFEGIREEMNAGAAARLPDFGPAHIHATAGAVAIGARPFLVAYNVYLGPASNIGVAKAVAKAVRGSSGGLRYVKGLGLEVDGQAQVSMNLVDTEKTPLYRAYDMVKMEAEAQGVSPTWSEIVGLVPGTGAVRDGGATHSASRFQAGDGAREQSARRDAGRRIAVRIRGVGGVARRQRPAAAASPRTLARWVPLSRRWSPASRPDERSTRPSTPRCASSASARLG